MDTPAIEQAAFADIWVAICAIARNEGSKPLNRLDGPYRIVAGKWRLWINGTKADLLATEEHPAIPRFDCYLEFNGWPAGSFNPHGGIVAAGEAANVFTLRDALKERAAP